MRERSSRPSRQYAAIPNQAMRDTRISIEARGLLAMLMTYADDWQFHKAHLMSISGLKDGKFSKVMKELRDAGYVEMISHRNEKGHLEGRTWVIRDEAPTETAKTTVSDTTETAFNRTSVFTETGENTPYKKNNSNKKTNRQELEANASLSSADDETAVPDEIQIAVDQFNRAAERSGWPVVRVLSKSRRSALAARLRECGGLEGWAVALAKAQASPHCCGQNDRGWVASFDFITRQSSFAKLMEGNYDNRNRNTGSQQRGSGRYGSGTVDAFAEVARRRAQGNA